MALLHPNTASPGILEPMNASSHHPKVKLSLTLADPVFVAGTHVSGKLEMECRADKGLGIGIMMVELFAIQELTSRDHSAKSTFIHSRRLFQGPGLPPSNAVHPHPIPGDPLLPAQYFGARRGHSTFLFRIPLPPSCPSSISFASGQAKIRYELRASVGVYWKQEKRLVVEKQSVDVVERFPYEEMVGGKVPEGVVVGELGKLWMQGRLVGGVAVSGGSACLELQVKNHSTKKNTGLTLTLTRTLYLPSASTGPGNTSNPTPVQISDTLTTVPFRGPEYIIPPGAEGVANLVFDVPKHARGARGGTLDGEEEGSSINGSGSTQGGGGQRVRRSESLFEIRVKVEVRLTLGMGSKDIHLEIPIEIVHPRAVPPPNELMSIGPFANPGLPTNPTGAYPPDPAIYANHPYYPNHPASPGPMALPYVDPTHNQVWLPPPGGFPMPYGPGGQDMYGQPLQPPQPMYYGAPQQQQQPIVGYNNVGLPMGSAHPHPHAGYALPTPPLHAVSHGALPTPPSHAFAHTLSQPMQAQHQHIQRPLSAGPVASASQMPQSMVPGLPAPEVVPVGLLPLPSGNAHADAGGAQQGHQPQSHYHGQNQDSAVGGSPGGPGAGQESEEGKGALAARVSRHLRLSSRHRSVSPPSHRYPMSGMPGVAEEEASPGHAHSNGNALGNTELIPTPAILHSPLPQLTPKHSFTHEQRIQVELSPKPEPDKPQKQIVTYHAVAPVLKSERVEELEKMADVVVRRSGDDLSGDLPRGLVERLEEEALAGAAGANDEEGGGAKGLRRDKTLPGPPVPSQKGALPKSVPMNVRMKVQETDPLPWDQTPPTPTLHALAVRGRDPNAGLKIPGGLADLRTESGLDALERRLLKEVGTRKMEKGARPDVRSVLNPGAGAEAAGAAGILGVQGGQASGRGRRGRFSPSPSPSPSRGKTPTGLDLNGRHRTADPAPTRANGAAVPIPIPIKSPEPLNDSAISSLTLAGGAGGDDMAMMGVSGGLGGGNGDDSDDADADARTHRAGSRSVSPASGGSGSRGRSNENGASGGVGGLHGHMRERAEGARLGRARTVKASDKDKDKDKKVHKSGHRKKDKSSAAKGRVAAWLGGIDVSAPPQEEIIPPSPSVTRPPGGLPLGSGGSAAPSPLGRVVGLPDVRDDADRDVKAANNDKANAKPKEDTSAATAAPNPRSSGFVPISTLNRSTIQLNTLKPGTGAVARPLVTRDATVVEEARKIQDLWSSSSPSGSAEGTPVVSAKYPMWISPVAKVQTVRTDRRVSPPSMKPNPSVPQKPTPATAASATTPMSYSAAARNVWKQVDQSASAGGSKPPIPTPVSSSAQSKSSSAARVAAAFASTKPPIDPEVKYDIRSARGGRGGKVTAVASLWASGALTNTSQANGKSKEEVEDEVAPQKPKRQLSQVAEEPRLSGSLSQSQSQASAPAPIPPKPAPPSKDTKPVLSKPERKSFSAALRMPAPPSSSVSTPSSSKPAVPAKPPPPTSPKPMLRPSSSGGALGGASRNFFDAQKRTDSRNIFQANKNLSTDALSSSSATRRPATSMATSNPTSHSSPSRSPYSFQGKVTSPASTRPTSASTPSSSDPKLHEVVGKATKPKPAIMPASTNPAAALVSSSHAVPHLSSTASLARPHIASAKAAAVAGPARPAVAEASASRPGVLSNSLSTPALASKLSLTMSSSSSSPAGSGPGKAKDLVSPSSLAASASPVSPTAKPVDLGFGQARLRDLIKKYQGQQKT